MKTIDNDVLDVLRASRFDGCCLFLEGTLGRGMYVKTDKVIKALGGKWSRREKSHVFDGDAADICADAISAGCYVDAKKQFDFFETPLDVAERLVRLAGVQAGDRVLEPSAGSGRISGAIEAAGGKVVSIEIQEKLADKLAGYGEVVTADFLSVEPPQTVGTLFDSVVMNPPFSRGQDMAHVRHAYEFLSPGGTLVSIMGPGFTFRSDRKAVEFREWLDFAGKYGAMWEDLPEGTFKQSGTMVRSVIVEIIKR